MIPSNNAVLDDFHAGRLDPMTKQRVFAKALQLNPELNAPAPALAPALTPTPAPEAEVPRPIAGPAPAVRGLGAPPAMEGSSNSLAIVKPKPKTPAMQELDRLRSSGSGISQQPKWARIPLQIADAIGSTFLPALTMSLPGTELHHRILENRAAGAVKQEQDVLNSESQRNLESAQSENQRAQAHKVTHPSISNAFELWASQNPNGTYEDWASAQEAHQPVTNEFQAWSKQNPGKPVSEYMKLKAENAPERTPTPFGVWREQNPDAPVEDWISANAKDNPLTAVSLAVRAAGGDPSSPDSITPEIAKKAGDILRPTMPGINLTPEAVKFWAGAAAAGIPLPSMGMGASGARARAQIINAAPVEAGGRSLVEARASQRADTESMKKLVTMRDSVSAFEKTASKNLDLFVRTAKPIIDSGSPWINTPLRMVGTSGMGSTDLAAYNAARQVALTEIAKVVNNPSLSSVLSDSARKEVMGLVPDNATLGQIYAVANVLKQDMANRGAGLDDQIRQVQTRMSGQGGGAETVHYTDGGKAYNIPAGQEQEFLKDHPNAQKR